MFGAIGAGTVVVGLLEGLGRVWLWALGEERAAGEWGCVLLVRLVCDVRARTGFWAMRRKARQFPRWKTGNGQWVR